MSNDGVVHVIDDEAVRDSLAFLFKSAHVDAQIYESASEFLASLPTSGRNCIVTDVRMHDLSGIDLLIYYIEASNYSESDHFLSEAKIFCLDEQNPGSKRLICALER